MLMENGMLAPIDLRVQPLSGALLDYVIKTCRDPHTPWEFGRE
jgi:hypothetical protein